MDYYRLKAAIAQVLQPGTILEIGVRYGYSAHAFLHGAPQARYLGIDNNSESFGGELNALDYARSILPAAQVTIIEGDTQQMPSLPGEEYDLIHVDGQQDGEGTYRDVEKAIAQGRHVLLDGVFWTETNLLATFDCLRKYRDALEWILIIPGYAGEVLVKVKLEFLEAQKALRNSSGGSSVLTTFYDKQYFLMDCGGHDTFKRDRSKRLEDRRLSSILDLIVASGAERLLDIGCGRGEIVYQAAQRGLKVTGVDYSPEALELARSTIENDHALSERIKWVQASAANLQLDEKYGAIVASDVVEHIAPSELENMCACVAKHLEEDGWFIVHTFPNRWYYQYDYSRRRRKAAGLGAYLSPEPRSRYERLMHINEQSPRELRDTLQRHFPHVLLWLGDPETNDPGGSLIERFGHRRAAAARDIYAIAGTKPIDPGVILALFQMPPCKAEDFEPVHLELVVFPREVESGGVGEARVRLRNNSCLTLNSSPPSPVYIAYHWLHHPSRDMAWFEGERTRISPACLPGITGEQYARIIVPKKPGEYILQMQLVQEAVLWVPLKKNGLAYEKQVKVRG